MPSCKPTVRVKHCALLPLFASTVLSLVFTYRRSHCWLRCARYGFTSVGCRGVPWGDAGTVSSVFCPSSPRWLALTTGRVLAPWVLKACAGASALSIDLLVRPCLIPSA